VIASVKDGWLQLIVLGTPSITAVMDSSVLISAFSVFIIFDIIGFWVWNQEFF
jgi:hypothetical protein